MNPDATSIWRAPRWALSVLLAALAMLGPFAIDTYIPAFSGIAKSLNATPIEMQQTLSAYLFGFAFMNLFHGALSDSFGRRPVILWGIGVFTLASIGCALSGSIGWLVFFRALQGLSTGAGIVVSRAVIRDMFPPTEAQRVMAQVTLFFGIAPAVAPVIGGWLYVHTNWQSIFWLLTAIGGLLWLANYRLLPETLHVSERQPFRVGSLMQGYREMCTDPRFLLLALASGVPFNGMFLYVLSAPAFLGEILALEPTEYYWFFLVTISGIMAGASLSGRLAGRVLPRRQIHRGFAIMFVCSVANVIANLLFEPDIRWALIPIGLFTFGWALMMPVVTLLVLDLYPERRGLASSLQAVVGSLSNAIVAGVIAPLVMHSAPQLAMTSLVMMSVGLLSWLYLRRFYAEATLTRPHAGPTPMPPTSAATAPE